MYFLSLPIFSTWALYRYKLYILGSYILDGAKVERHPWPLLPGMLHKEILNKLLKDFIVRKCFSVTCNCLSWLQRLWQLELLNLYLLPLATYKNDKRGIKSYKLARTKKTKRRQTQKREILLEYEQVVMHFREQETLKPEPADRTRTKATLFMPPEPRKVKFKAAVKLDGWST